MKRKECPSCAMEIDSREAVCPICGYEFTRTSSVAKWVAILLAVLMFLYLLF